jgi:predicted RNA polymerase sigma factor
VLSEDSRRGIAGLYAELAAFMGSAVIKLNRGIAVSMAESRRAGFENKLR